MRRGARGIIHARHEARESSAAGRSPAARAHSNPAQKIVSGPAVFIVLILAFTLYAAVRYLPVWP